MNNFMITTTYLLCNYSNKKGSHCSSLSIISLAAGRRKEFPFLGHSCVQSLLSQLHLHPTWKLCFPKAQSIHFWETAGLDLSSDKHTNHLTERMSNWNPVGKPYAKYQCSWIVHTSQRRHFHTKHRSTSLIWLILFPATHVKHKRIPFQKRIVFLRMNTAEPKIFSDQHGPNQLTRDLGQWEPLSKLNSLRKASKLHGFDWTLATNILKPLTQSFDRFWPIWQHQGNYC